MNKKEFLLELRDYLQDNVSEREIERQVRYYDSYITSAVQDGKDETTVVETLGDPKWIAKSVIQSKEGAEPVGNNRSASFYNEDETSSTFFLNGTPIRWYHKLVVLGMFLLVVAAMLAFSFSFMRIVISIIMPLAILFFVFWIILLIFKR